MKEALIKALRNRNGFTLVEIMIAVGVLGGLTLVLMQVMKSQTKTSVKTQIEADLAQMKTEIQSLINNPANCNANFKGRAAGTIALTSLLRCNIPTVNCKTTGTTTGVVVPQLAVDVTPNWAPGANRYSQKVRIKSISLEIQNTSPPGGTSPLVLTPIVLTVTTEDRMPRVAGESTLKKETVMKFYTTGVYNGTSVVGCPQSLNSTLIY